MRVREFKAVLDSRASSSSLAPIIACGSFCFSVVEIAIESSVVALLAVGFGVAFTNSFLV